MTSPEKRTYGIWKGMKTRCFHASEPAYQHYGGRGIVVCDRWMEFENFLADMGPAPAGLSIDRIDNDGNYEPGNCRWATLFQQANNTRRNKRLTLNGVTLTMSEWSRKTGLSRQVIWSRLFVSGWTVEKALTTPAIAEKVGAS